MPSIWLKSSAGIEADVEERVRAGFDAGGEGEGVLIMRVGQPKGSGLSIT
jgi:hypothetical protein